MHYDFLNSGCLPQYNMNIPVKTGACTTFINRRHFNNFLASYIYSGLLAGSPVGFMENFKSFR